MENVVPITEHKVPNKGYGDIDVEWSNPPELAQLKEDLENALPYNQSHYTQVQQWLENIYLKNHSKDKKKEARSKIQPKLIRKQAEWRYASLSDPFLTSPDIFDVRPVTFEDKAAAVQNAQLLNHQFTNKINRIDFIDEYVRTAVDEGTVIVRTGWNYTTEKRTVDKPTFEYFPAPEMIQQLQEGARMYEENQNEFFLSFDEEMQESILFSMERGNPFLARIKETKEVEEDFVTNNHPTVEVCAYEDITIDPTCRGDISKAKFIVYEFETSLAELYEKGDLYENLEHINVKDSAATTDDTPSGHTDHHGMKHGNVKVNPETHNFSFNDEIRKKLIAREYWGFWDVEDNNKLVPFVCTWVGDVMIRLQENPYPHKKLPFTLVQYLPVRHSVYGEPDGELLEDNQAVIGAVTRGMIDAMARTASNQTGVAKNLLDPVNFVRFKRGDDYQFNVNTDPRIGIYQHKFGEIPAAAHEMLALQNQEAESLTGVKAFNTGLTGDAFGTTATGTRGVLDSASQREAGILRRMAKGVIDIGQKIAAMNGEFLSDTEVIRITNDKFVPIRRDELAGEFDFRLSISTAEDNNAKANDLTFLLQTLGPNSDPGLVNMILAEIATIRKMPDLAHRLETYQPQPTPESQLEIEKLRAEIDKIRSEANENNSEAALDQAKAQEASAKTGLIGAQTDQATLDFVEQESGTKQERELQQQTAQARGNIELKRAEANLKRQDESAKKLEDDQIRFADAFLNSRAERNSGTSTTNPNTGN